MAPSNPIDELQDIEELETYLDDAGELPSGDIVSYNELRSCADLVRMYESEQLIIRLRRGM